MREKLCHVAGVLTVLMVVLPGCGKRERGNPLDPLSPRYVYPWVKLEDMPVSEGGTVYSDTVTFSWKGSSTTHSEFSWRFDENEWSAWSSDANVIMLLDEGKHRFDVMTRYRGGKQDDIGIVSHTFTVNALDTPAVFLYPRQTRRSGDTVNLEIRAKGLLPSGLFHFRIADARFKETSSGYFHDTVAELMVLDGDFLGGDSTILRFTAQLADTTQDTVRILLTECVAESLGVARNIRMLRGSDVLR